MTLVENLQNLRRAKGLSQDEVAEKLFVTRQSVSKWETDKAEPGVENLKTLARLYGVSVDVLVGAEETPEKPAVSSDSAYRQLLKFRLAAPAVVLLGAMVADKHLNILMLLGEFLVPGAAAMLLGWWVRNHMTWGILMAVEAFSVLVLSILLGIPSPFLGPLAFVMGGCWLWRLCQTDIQRLFFKEDEIP